MNFKLIFRNGLLLLFTFITTSGIYSQNHKVSDFKIIVETKAQEIQLKCEKGCAWRELTFGRNDDQPQAVDEYGMTKLNEISKVKNPELADFLFEIVKTKDGVRLKGIEGTAWTNLGFSLRSFQAQGIDAFGMVD